MATVSGARLGGSQKTGTYLEPPVCMEEPRAGALCCPPRSEVD